MIRSMTSFGQGQAPLAGGELTVEVRSVNSRHLDLRVRLPRELAGFEALVREVAGARFGRGQVEIVVRVSPGAAPAADVEIDVVAAGRYAEAAERLRRDHGAEGGLSAEALLSLPGVARVRDREHDREAIQTALRPAVAAACQAAADMRLREGQALDRELRSRLLLAEDLIARVEAGADEIQKSLLARLAKRVAALAPQLELDPGRLEQEAVLYADRQDVTEETVRSRSHFEQFRETLEAEGPVGRKLEFLLQEMGREANTIGSKAADTRLSRLVVDLKSEYEKLREQILNVE